jgi:hypothetical protein
MESDVSENWQAEDNWQEEIVMRKQDADRAREKLDDALQWAVVTGKSYTLLGQLLGYSDSAIRVRALRHGWDKGRRIPRG